MERILTRVGDKSFIILGIHAVSEQGLHLLVIQALTCNAHNDLEGYPRIYAC